MTYRMDSLLEQRRLDELSKKAFECKRIIDHLEYIQKKEEELKEYLTDYIWGDTTSEQLQYFVKQNFMPIAKYRIRELEDATRQLGDKLSDNKLRLDFLSYIEAFRNLLLDFVKRYSKLTIMCSGLCSRLQYSLLVKGLFSFPSIRVNRVNRLHCNINGIRFHE